MGHPTSQDDQRLARRGLGDETVTVRAETMTEITIKSRRVPTQPSRRPLHATASPICPHRDGLRQGASTTDQCRAGRAIRRERVESEIQRDT